MSFSIYLEKAHKALCAVTKKRSDTLKFTYKSLFRDIALREIWFDADE